MNIRKTLVALFLTLCASFGILASGVAHADYTTQTTCATAVLGNRLCIDISANTATIYTNNTAIYRQEAINGPLVAVGPLPTRGWIAYGPTCYGASGQTAFQTGPSYGLNSAVVTVFAGSGSHGWNDVPVSAAFANDSAYFAAIDNAYECVIVP